MAFAPGSKARLTGHDVGRFPGSTLFDRIARVVCGAGCLPRKELYEAWETARRVRRKFRGGRIVDVGGGHGLLAQLLLLLDDSSPRALIVDPAVPPSAAVLLDAIAAAWPRIAGRVAFQRSSLDDAVMTAEDLVVSSHACGVLTDHVLAAAAAARARVAVLPCCHDLAAGRRDLSGWVDGALAADLERAVWLRQQGYEVWTHTIPADVTPKNRLLMGEPRTTRVSISLAP